MPVYRYRFIGADQVKLDREVPGSTILGSMGISTFLDVTASAPDKPDLDNAMAVRGYSYVSQDPVTTPAEESTNTIDHDDLANVTINQHHARDHAGTHSNGGADEVTVENLGTGSLDTSNVLKPNGAGGLVFADLVVSDLPLHASTHNPGGTDALATASAIAASVGQVNAEGVAASFARSDHTHAHATAAPVSVTKDTNDAGVALTFSRSDHKHDIFTATPTAALDIGDAAVEGIATSLARSDHQHAFPVPGGIPPAIAAAGAVGVATTPARSDHTHAGITDIGGNTGSIGYGVAGDITQIDIGDPALAGTSLAIARADHQHALPTPAAPVNVDTAAAVAGVSTIPARADHKHNIATAAPNAGSVGTSPLEGTSLSLARADHIHQANTAPVNVTKLPAVIGVSTEPARADHKHDITTAAAVDIAQANAEGTSTSLARADHIHSHGDQPLGDGLDHALVTTLVAGFMSPADKAYLENSKTVTKFFTPTGNSVTNKGSYATVSVGSNATLNISFEFPADFVSLISLEVTGIPVGTFASKDIDLFSQYAADGELFNVNAQSDITSVYSGTIDRLMQISISHLYTSAAANDHAGIMIDHNSIGTTILYIGINMIYLRD